MKEFKDFLNQYRVKSFRKGEIILCEGEVPAACYVIKSGTVKSYNLTLDGQEKPISFDTELEAFPLGWAFKKLKFSQFFYEAFTNCELYVVPADDYVRFLRSHPEVLYDAFEFMLDRYLNFQMRVNALEQSKAVDKVIHTLHFLSVRFGKDVKPNLVKIELPLTQQDLANIMGLTRETTGIELKKLERNGIIRYRRQNYLIYTDKLNELLDIEYGSVKLD